MPRSFSKSIASRCCAWSVRSSTVPVDWSNRSDRVVFPWSMWAMMLKLRMCAASIVVQNPSDAVEPSRAQSTSATGAGNIPVKPRLESPTLAQPRAPRWPNTEYGRWRVGLVSARIQRWLDGSGNPSRFQPSGPSRRTVAWFRATMVSASSPLRTARSTEDSRKRCNIG